MKTEITNEKKNPFLGRTEYILEIKNESTPNEMEVKEALGKNVELTVIKKINTNFGKQSFVVEAVVYDSEKDKENVEVIPQKIRKKIEAEKETAKKAEEEAKKKAEEEKAAAEEEAKEAKKEEKTE